MSEARLLWLYAAPLVDQDGDPLALLDVEREKQTILRELRGCGRQLATLFAPATTNSLSEALRQGYNLLHYTGHGHADYLAFEDGTGGLHAVRGDWLGRVLGIVGTFQLAVVSACHSESIGKALVTAGVQHVVAIRLDTPVLDSAAIVFAREFYRHLFSGQTVQYAFDMAKLMVEGDPKIQEIEPLIATQAVLMGEAPVSEHEKFVLLPAGQDFSRHQQALFRDLPLGPVANHTPPEPLNNLPTRPTSFTGRSKEMHDLIAEILTHRFVSVIGAPGIGKTTLAAEVLRWFSGRSFFPDGIFVVNTRESTTIKDLLPVFAHLIGKDVTTLENLLSEIRDKRCVILLDNYEDLIVRSQSEAQALCDRLLRGCPALTLLVTTQREVGGLLHETERCYRPGALRAPYDAILFSSVAKRALLPQEVHSEEFTRVRTLLGGHPLSLVLAARQLTQHRTLHDLERLLSEGDVRQLRVAGSSTPPARHDSLLAAMSVSYGSLSANAQLLFRIFGLLPGGFQKTMLQHLANESTDETMEELLDANLIEVFPGMDRYWQLPAIRLFAKSMITDAEKDALIVRVFAVLAMICIHIRMNILSSDSGFWRFAFTLEEPSFREVALLRAKIQPKPDVSVWFAFLDRLLELYRVCNRYDSIPWLVGVGLAGFPEDGARRERGVLLVHDGFASHLRGALNRAQERYQEAVRILRAAADPMDPSDEARASLAYALTHDGDLKMRLGNFQGALAAFEEARQIAEALDDAESIAVSLHRKSLTLFRMGEPASALATSKESMAILEQNPEPNPIDEMNMLRWYGGLLAYNGQNDTAESYFDRALEKANSLAESRGTWQVFEFRGHLRLSMGHADEVRTDAEKCWDFYRRIDDHLGQAEALLLMCLASAAVGDLNSAEAKAQELITLYRENRDWHHPVRWLVYHHSNAQGKPEALRKFVSGLARRMAAESGYADLKNVVGAL